MACATGKASDQPAHTQSDQSLCWSLEYSMNIKLVTELHLEFLNLKGGYTGLFEATLVKMPHCWISHVAAHLILLISPVLTLARVVTKCARSTLI